MSQDPAELPRALLRLRYVPECFADLARHPVFLQRVPLPLQRVFSLHGDEEAVKVEIMIKVVVMLVMLMKVMMMKVMMEMKKMMEFSAVA